MTASVKDGLLSISPGHRSFWLKEVGLRMSEAVGGVSEAALNEMLDRPREEFNGLSLVQAVRQSVNNFHYAEDILDIEIG